MSMSLARLFVIILLIIIYIIFVGYQTYIRYLEEVTIFQYYENPIDATANFKQPSIDVVR